MKKSIIITYYSGFNILKTGIQLLLPTIDEYTEIIIVNDNPSAHFGGDDIIKPVPSCLKIVHMERNGGYAAACNFGAQSADGDLLIFMDGDIMPTEHWLEPLVYTFQAEKDCGAVSSTILNMNTGNVVHWGMGMLHGVDVLKPFRDYTLPSKLDKGVYEFNLLTSGCLLVPKKIFFRVKGFDFMFYNGYCDLDLIMKIRALNLRCLVNSESVVYHRGKVAGQARIAAEEDTRAMFIRKWGEMLPNDSAIILRHLYLMHDEQPHSNSTLLINFSRSLYASEYHDIIREMFGLNMICYDFKNASAPNILLEDHLSWSICGRLEPIIYFCDNVNSVIQNKHWFLHRKDKHDFIADRNGNLISCDTLLEDNSND